MTYSFCEFTLDTRRCELLRGEEACHLEPQVYAVLRHLVENHDRLVTREELLDEVWGHRFVTGATLSSRIRALRRALGDDGGTQRLVRTVRGRGFRFVAEVLAEAGPVPPAGRTGSARSAGAPAGRPMVQTIRFLHAADGVRIAYAVSGSGPPLVKPANWLTHLEFDWASPVWRHWLGALSERYALIRYDERGNGLSDLEVEDLSFDAWVRDLEAVVDTLGLDRFPLFGVSQGCAVAIAYAARHPERVSRLVLYGGYAQGRLARARNADDLREAELMIRVMPQGWGRDNPAFRNFFAHIFLPEATAEQVQWFSDLQRVTTTPENAVRLRTTAGWIDVREEARLVRAPTLVVHARREAAVPFEQGRLLASLVPGARFVTLESQNHILLEDEPAWTRLLEEVESFLAEDGAAGLGGADSES